ncbi:hypothetical protein DRW03_29080 [Corallococcus sp. H22C18031201]|nr:hypothetical protein DRW03_29080 [Corallococcus sp. H22C18031201]
MPQARVLISRGSADGGWATDVAQALVDTDGQVTVDILSTNMFNTTEGSPRGQIIRLSQVAQIGQTFAPTPQATAPLLASFAGILADNRAVDGSLAVAYSACSRLLSNYTHVAVPPTGAGTIPMAMHDYAIAPIRRLRHALRRSPNLQPNPDLHQVNLGAPGEQFLSPWLQFDVGQYGRSLLIEMCLITAAYRRGMPIYATCHGAQLMWFMLGGRLHRIPTSTQNRGWRAGGTSVSISGGIMRVRTLNPNNSKQHYFRNPTGPNIGRTRRNAHEWVEGESSPQAPMTLPEVQSRGRMRQLMKNIRQFDFQHASYMVGDLPEAQAELEPHPLVRCPPPVGMHAVGLLPTDLPGIVGAYQIKSVYAFQHHPHKVAQVDPEARAFLRGWLGLQASFSIPWL